MSDDEVQRMLATEHADLEFAVDGFYTHDFSAAMGRAVQRALAHGQPVALDVIVWSEDAARAYGGEEAVAVYREDPEASVHDRIVVTAASQGRIA